MKVRNIFRKNNDLSNAGSTLLTLIPIVGQFYNDTTRDTERVKNKSLSMLSLFNCVKTIVDRLMLEDFPELSIDEIWDELKPIRGEENKPLGPIGKLMDVDYNYSTNRWYEATIIFGCVYFIFAIDKPEKTECLNKIKEKCAYNDESAPYLAVFEQEVNTYIKKIKANPEAYGIHTEKPAIEDNVKNMTAQEWIAESQYASWRLNALRTGLTDKTPEEKYNIYTHELQHEQKESKPSATYIDLMEVDMRAIKSQMDSSNQKMPDNCISIDEIIKTVENYFSNDAEKVLNVVAYVVAQSNGSYLDKIESTKKAILEKQSIVNQQVDSNVNLNSKKGFKVDFIRIINVMQEMDFFVDTNNKKSTKVDVFNVLGKAINKDLSKFQNDLSTTNATSNSDMKSILKIFEDMLEKQKDINIHK